MLNPPDQLTRVLVACNADVISLRRNAAVGACSGTVCAGISLLLANGLDVSSFTLVRKSRLLDSCWVRYTRGVRAKRFKLTRLETRTKESTHMREYVKIYIYVRNESSSWDFCTNGRL